MKEQSVKNSFLDIIDGKMSDDEQTEKMEAIENNSELKEAFSQYRAIIELEDQLVSSTPTSAPDLTPGIMEHIADAKHATWHFSALTRFFRPAILIPVAGFATACFAFFISTSTQLNSERGIATLSAPSLTQARSNQQRNELEKKLQPKEDELQQAMIERQQELEETLPLEYEKESRRASELAESAQLLAMEEKAKDLSVKLQEAESLQVAKMAARKPAMAKSAPTALAGNRSVKGQSSIVDLSKAPLDSKARDSNRASGEGSALYSEPKKGKQIRRKLNNGRWDKDSLGSILGYKTKNYANLPKPDPIGVNDEVLKSTMANSGSKRRLKKDFLDNRKLERQDTNEKKQNRITTLGTKYPQLYEGSHGSKTIRDPLAIARNMDKESPITYGSRRRSYPQQPKQEQYGIWQENPREQVSNQPRSTFSIDVDTGSYTNSRRYLLQGQLPPQNAVRVEEFINYFDYNYPRQTVRPFSFHYEIAPSPFDSTRHFLKLGIKARDAINDGNTAWNLAFLVDVSGSMQSRNKLPLLKKSLRELVKQMRSSDRLSIVTYASSARVILPATSGKDKSRIMRAIDSLRAGGNTNGSAGIDLAYQTLENNRISNGINRIILATDGDFNQGTYSFSGLMRLIQDKRRSGISLTTLGFGSGNLKENNLEQLADKGNGNYFYIDSFEEAKNVLTTKAISNIETVAKDVKLQIEFNPEQVFEYRLIGYENRKLANHQFSNDQVDAGEIGAGHTVTAVYEVVLAGNYGHPERNGLRYQKPGHSRRAANIESSDFNSELAFLKIRYKEPKENNSKLLEFPLETSKIRSSLAAASDNFRFVAAVSYFAQLLRGSQYANGYSYHDVAELARGAIKSDDEHGHRAELLRLIQAASSKGYYQRR